MPIRDSLLDAVGFGGAGQLAHQLEGKRDSAAEAVAGGDAAVYDDFLIVDDGTYTGCLELALILWDASENIRMIVQNVHANKVHVFQPGAKGAKGLHFFFSPDDITAA